MNVTFSIPSSFSNSCYIHTSTFNAVFKRFQNHLLRTLRYADLINIDESIEENCFASELQEAEAPEDFQEDRFKFGCRNEVTSKYIFRSNNEEVKRVWAKYSEIFIQEVSLLLSCKEK